MKMILNIIKALLF